MNRDQVLAELRRHRQDIEQHFGIKHLSVFGSAARDELREDSDIDMLVEFKGKATFDGYKDEVVQQLLTVEQSDNPISNSR